MRGTGIYCFENETEKKVYIGQSSDLERRKYSHYHTIKKYQDEFHLNLRENPENFEYRVLEYCTIDELSSKELYWIDWYKNNTEYSLYNKRRQGFNSRGKKPTENQIQKIKEGLKEYYSKNPGVMLGKHHSEEHRKKISESNKGRVAWNKGLTEIYSEETRKKISESNKGKIPWNKGKHHSEEAKRKISEAGKGREPWNKGKKASEESRKKMSESQKGKHRSEEFKKNLSDIYKGKHWRINQTTGKREWY